MLKVSSTQLKGGLVCGKDGVEIKANIYKLKK